MASEPQPPPTTTTIPSNPTTNTPTPKTSPSEPTSTPSPPSSPRTSAIQKLRTLLLRLLSRLATSTDRNLIRLSKLLSSPSATDALLCTISYTLTFIHSVSSKLLESRLASVAAAIAAKAEGVLLPGETLIATLPAPTSTKLLAHAVGSSKALADTISDFRLFVRLWGLVGLYTWARGTWKAPLAQGAARKDRVLRSVTWAQIASCVAFQVLENGAYLNSKGALTANSWAGEKGKAKETLWWVWSSRFWAVHVGLEFVRLGVLWVCDEDGKEGVKHDDGEKEDKLKREERKREKWLWYKDVINNLAYFPMTLHWSVEPGILSSTQVGLCGMVAGGSNLVDFWRKTR